MEIVRFSPIGVIRSPFRSPKGTPIQPVFSENARGRIELLPEYKDGLKDLEGFSHITIVYHTHLARGRPLVVRPFMDSEERGVFATRSPSRPNPIGISVVRLISVKGSVLEVEGIDALDNTPLLDIKPFVPEFSPIEGIRRGWLERALDKGKCIRDDGRFSTES